jgi:hypothetical protein
MDPISSLEERNRRNMADGLLIWGVKGAESVQCMIPNDAKERATVIAAISAAGEKLHMAVGGKSKLPRFLPQDQPQPKAWANHSESGWPTSEAMIGHLPQSRQGFFPS